MPQSARVWNYWLGGKDNDEVDRVVGEQIRQVTPQVVDGARSSRAFLRRAVEYLAGPAEVRQFLDVGTGLPSAESTPGGAGPRPGAAVRLGDGRHRVRRR